MRKVAFVVQRYGLEVNGGAEVLCRSTAEHMSRYWDVEVLTTCALDYLTWRNEYRAGVEKINGVTVRRFPVKRPRNWNYFRLLSRLYSKVPGSKALGIEWMRAQGPYSPGLFDFIKRERAGYDFFIFSTYLYCTTFFGLPLVKEKSALVPNAEDSAPLRYGIFKDLFGMPKAFIYNTPEEKALLSDLYGTDRTPGEVVGVGVDMPKELDGERFRRKFKVEGDFLLYVGRITVDKGCGEMFDYFARYKAERPGPLKLILLGKAVMGVPKHPDIVELGFVSEEEKFDALDAALLLLMPSPYESLSIVLLEAWLALRPVLVNEKCAVMKGQCERSGGGLCYGDFSGFREQMDRLVKDGESRARLAGSGKAYVVKNYSWEVIERKYLRLADSMAEG